MKECCSTEIMKQLRCCSKCGKIDLDVKIKGRCVSINGKYITFRCVNEEDCSNSKTGIQFEKYYGKQLFKYIKYDTHLKQLIVTMLLSKRIGPTQYESMYDILNNIDEVKYNAERMRGKIA